jgi:serralysin
MTKVFLTTLLLGSLTMPSQAQRIGCSTRESGDEKIKVDFHANSSDTTKSRGLADNYFLWDPGATIKVKILNGSTALQTRVMNAAKIWENYANVKFNFVKSGNADIRVYLGKGNGHNSFVGTVSQQISSNEPTMNLDTVDLGNSTDFWRSTTLHEFGHALGLLHEHSSPISGIKWDKEKIYKEYARMGWTRDDVDNQVFETYNKSYTNGTKYDNKSIMHYPIMTGETINGYTVDWNLNLSKGDIDLISALYPKKGKRKNEVTRVNVQNFNNFSVLNNKEKNGISLFPEFDLKTGDIGGTVKMLFKFYDAEGYGLRDSDGKYQENGTVAIVRTVNLPAKKLVSYNRKKQDFEFFLPMNQFPQDAIDEDLLITFKIVHTTKEGEQKNLYLSEPMSFKYVKK